MLLSDFLTDFIYWKLYLIIFEKCFNIFFFIISFSFPSQMMNHERVFRLILLDSYFEFSFKSNDEIFECFDLILFVLYSNRVLKLWLIELRCCFELFDFDLIVQRFYFPTIGCIKIFKPEYFLIFFFQFILIFLYFCELLFETVIKSKGLWIWWFWTTNFYL